MSILFLDIDGVLCSSRSAVALGGLPQDFSPESVRLFDPCALGLVRQVCNDTQCSIVLSSSWRIRHDWREMKRVLELPLIGATPDGKSLRTSDSRTPPWLDSEIEFVRGHEIAAWLMANGSPDRYAILDDEPDAGVGHAGKFVQTRFENGMQWQHYQRLMTLL